MGGFRILADPAPWPAEAALTLSVPSRLDCKQPCIDRICALLGDRGAIAPDDQPWLVLCLDEAIVNAMLHGNEGDPDLDVRIAVTADAERWAVWIGDRGAGFSPDDVPDIDDPASLMLEHGRGIRLMSSWLDDLTYFDRGATIRMTRRNAARSAST